VADGVLCPSCGAANDEGRKFCGQCGSPLALTCPSCGAANPPSDRFCGECGTALTAAAVPAPAAAPAAERRLVSVLFADLVGFTTASEDRDSEETRDLLSRYFETARTLVERYGGTVEKFIGDAVMAVWGTPVAQEDDAERAVRTALDLVGAIPALDPSLEVRAGVLTGEAAVTLGAEGQGMVAGDLVNTASRIQSAAEPGTVLVGDATKRASEAAVAYEDAGERELKGKAEAVQLWRALRVVANRGGEGRASALEAPFVGREREFRMIKDLFHATGDDGRATLVTVVGVAGIGKSRLAWELEKHIDGLADVVWWHRGRCLAYGEGVAFWALAEMVRMRARITEDEPEESAVEKLGAVMSEQVTDHGEREWVEPLLRHLLGLGERPAVERTDLFSAWRLFFERMSETAPVALVFEDLHWADTALLDFIEHLLEWSRAKPIFVFALTRPELLERRGDFGSHGRSATRLVLEPLSDEAVDALLDGLVPGLPSDVRTQIRERADGIPLYAVETVRMLLDRGALERDGDTLRVVGPLETIDVPETLHALIAARLDGLEPDERQLIQHAAVLGKTFGARGLAALGAGEESSVTPVLERLVRKELLVLDDDPRSPERGQYGFLQALVQRVAYETLARRDRGRLHRAAAAYLERDAGIDPDEIAEVIAAHHRDALEADPSGPEADDSRRAACAWLERAGRRAASLGAPEDGQRAFDDAAAIATEPLERARLLEQAGDLALKAARMEAAEERLRASVETFTAAGDTHGAARAASFLGLALWNLDRTDEALETLRPAFEALANEEHDVDVGGLAAELARLEFFSGDSERAREHADLALDIGEAHADMALIAQALNTKNLTLGSHLHERRALLREAVRIAEEHDLTEALIRAINNSIVLAEEMDRPDESMELLRRGMEIARARGHRRYLEWFGGGLALALVEEGEWNDALEIGRETLPEGVSYVSQVANASLALATAAFERGDDDDARSWLDRVPGDLEASTNFQMAYAGPARAALEAFLAGRLADGAGELGRAWEMALAREFWPAVAEVLQRVADAAAVLDDPAPAAGFADRCDALPASAQTRHLRAMAGRVRAVRAAAAGDEDGAADAFADALAAARSLGRKAPLASVLADYGVWLVECGRHDEAEPLLDEARQLYEHMGAQRWLDRIAAARPKAELTA
jgi:class 3 adenylate cyclase/tetratricopeptide (TPR) repeat protein